MSKEVTNTEEYLEKMKELGWKEEQLTKIIKAHEDAKKEGIIIPYTITRPEPPLEY